MQFEELGDDYENETEETIIEEIILSENYNAVVKAIKELDEIYSITLFYYYVEELSPKEIANLLGIQDNTVYARIRRGKAKLIEKLKGKITL